MAHEIEENKAFYTVLPAWHNLGTTLENAPTIQEACALAYPHSIAKLALDARIPIEDGSNEYLPISSHSAVVRDDGKILGVVGSGYEIIQPSESFEFFSPFVDAGLVELESGGSLREGTRMWSLAKVKDGIADVLPGDAVKAYFLVYTSFDGSLPHGIMPTNVRVVCANTLRSAMNADNGKNSYKFKHTKNVRISIEMAQREIAKSLNQFQEDVNVYRELAKKPINDIQLERYVREVLEVKNTEEPSSRMENKVQHIIDWTLLQPERELVPAMAGTAWNAYNGITHYLQHEYGNSDDSRTNALWFGQSAQTSQRALNLAMTM